MPLLVINSGLSRTVLRIVAEIGVFAGCFTEKSLSNPDTEFFMLPLAMRSQKSVTHSEYRVLRKCLNFKKYRLLGTRNRWILFS